MTKRQGDLAFRKVDKLPEGETQKAKHHTLAYGEKTEKILECGCHKIDSNGNVYSKLEQFSKKEAQGIQTKVGDKWIKLNCTVTNYGYTQVGLHGKSIRVNRLVAENFIENPNSLPEAQHINGVRSDNRVSNLKWGTAKENAKDRNNHGNTVRGSKQPNSKLTEAQALEVFNSPLSLQKTADKYGVSKKAVLLIKQKKTWKHIHDDFMPIQNSVVLAFGEKTLHEHRLTGHFNVYEYEDGKYIEVKAKAILTHGVHQGTTIVKPEHKPVEFEPGIYRMTVERQRDPFLDSIRKVED